ncbi:hypothetical protein AX769_11425 [Frondihabitans sp. PAMC 28766]|uniref:hypothetical protein n=1 Tax=Frondihabitans sp. PAMC 28766 TaxID=1795630 RepID=UPI00078CEC1B|nr:hypothetical protein [Frondihabitans sp. PAMC 28766]AMM20642.1 hypothetical protein AX769_11425 [Frondihabitans sp. PAMC 28766]
MSLLRWNLLVALPPLLGAAAVMLGTYWIRRRVRADPDSRAPLVGRNILLATLGAAVLLPLLVVVGLVGLTAVVWSTHLPVSVPLLIETTHLTDEPGGGVDIQAGPLFAVLAAVLFVGLALGLYFVLNRQPLVQKTSTPRSRPRGRTRI